MLDNPMIRPELVWVEAPSLDDGAEYDQDEDYLQEVVAKHTDLNMADYANKMADQMIKVAR